MEIGYSELFVLVLLGCEIFESWWQHDGTLGGVLVKIRYHFHTHLFLLFAMHPSFWFLLFLFVARGFHGTLLGLILVMKASDIAFKLWIVKKIDEDALSPDFRAMLAMPLSPWMPWINVVIYPALLALSLQT
ncbi:hypothetical protein [Hydrogenimonas urashimensis]|uniref:hypothetical protein n=1 Tax=Hydrogenimonas urashimensis TaxID=2740515 RepID=UPI00191626B9|nr:hypothetical protein [Hydrogenimonas urashimensis]